MGNSLRCCLACILPCGALDVIRIVHLNGYVEEITRSNITAKEILELYPNHVLSKPCSQNMVRKIIILSQNSELKRGGIYFLIPDSSLPTNHSKTKSSKKCKKIITTQKSISCDDQNDNVVIVDNAHNSKDDDKKCVSENLCTLDHEYVQVCETNLKSKSISKSGKHQRRRSSRGKSGIWQPHLMSITEDL